MRKPQRKIIRQKVVTRELIAHRNPDAIRSFHIRAYQAQLSSLKSASEKIRRFVEVDQPGFTLWWQQVFAEQLAEHANLEESLNKLELFTSAVEHYKLHTQCPYHRAYAVVSKAKEEGQLGELMQKIFESMAAERSEKPRIDPASLFEAQKKFDSEAPPAQQSFNAAAFQEIAPQTPEETTEGYIKKMYRDLVRILHPDTKQGVGEEQTAQDKQLWDELQNAYAWQDLDRIEAVFKTVKGQAAAAIDFTKIPIGDIFAMKEAVVKKLNTLRRDIKEAKKEANWDFENRRKNPSYIRQLGQAIENELIDHTLLLEARIQKLQRQVQSWASAYKKHKQKSPRREAFAEDSPQP